MESCCSPLWLKFFKAVSDNHRQKIISFIKKNKTVNASQVVKNLKLSQPTISHHLKILTATKLISSKKIGKEIFYSINKKIASDCCLGFLNKLTRSS